MTQSQMSHSVTDTFAACYWLKQATEPAHLQRRENRWEEWQSHICRGYVGRNNGVAIFGNNLPA